MTTEKNNIDGPEFSVVISCYYEERSIDEFYERLSKTMQGLGRSYEIIFVNDGSTDRTFEKLKAIFDKDENVSVIIDLFKNSGQAAAVTAGLTQVRGKAVILVESDLQVDPEDLPKIISLYDEGYDCVSGCRKNRQDPTYRKIASRFANIIMRRVSDSQLTDFGCIFKIFNSEIIHAFNYGPFNVIAPAYLIAKISKTSEVSIAHHARKYGKSGYDFGRLMQYNMDNAVGMSQRPFQYLLFFCLMLSFIFVCVLTVGLVPRFRIFSEISNLILLLSIFICFLLNLIVLSAIGELVIRNFKILRKEPAYIIKTRIARF